MAGKHNELVAREGWIFLFPMILLAVASALLGWHIIITAILAILAFYVAWFFRNPYRQISEDPAAIISPADGKVVGVQRLEDGRHLITIFLNIFNVHVNRCPIGGKIEQVQYHKGLFLAAYKEEASSENERNHVTIRDEDFKIEVIQIAGLIARRIICWVKEADEVRKGERFGLIRFGSRMDLILPAECEILTRIGQKVAGGSDILARRADKPS